MAITMMANNPTSRHPNQFHPVIVDHEIPTLLVNCRKPIACISDIGIHLRTPLM
jgi:hypothetical protein